MRQQIINGGYNSLCRCYHRRFSVEVLGTTLDMGAILKAGSIFSKPLNSVWSRGLNLRFVSVTDVFKVRQILRE